MLWEEHLNPFCEDIVNKSYWTTSDFLSTQQTKVLLDEALRLEAEDALRPAAVGKGLNKNRNTEIRTDRIHWIDKFDTEPTKLIHEILDGLMQISKREFFLPLKRFECHFSKYDVGGFYKKHTDRHEVMPSRILSCVIYLSDMSQVTGGELILYPEKNDPVVIQPLPGKIVVFKSELEHEVKACSATRRSLTAWLRDDLHPSLNLT